MAYLSRFIQVSSVDGYVEPPSLPTKNVIDAPLRGEEQVDGLRRVDESSMGGPIIMLIHI